MCILSSIKGVNQVDFFEEETEERWVSEFKLKPPEELEHCKLIVFHDPDVTEPVPCKDVADEIVFVPHLPAGGPKYSVSDMFATIRGDE